MNRKYGPEHIDWLRDHITGCHFKELTEAFNSHFGLSLSVGAMVSLTDAHGLHNGIDCRFNTAMIEAGKAYRFPKGHVPANKGVKGKHSSEATEFKKGHAPANYRPVGSERVNVDGYVEIKVADPKKWVGKHTYVWEEHNGPVPKGYVVIFGDGDRNNFDINNLILVSRQQLVRLNQCGLIQIDADLTRTAVIMVDLKQKIHDVSKKRTRTK